MVTTERTELEGRVESARTDPTFTRTTENGTEILKKSGSFTNFVSDRMGGRIPTKPTPFTKREFRVLPSGKIISITRDVRVTQQDRSIQTFSPFESKKLVSEGDEIRLTTRFPKGIGRGFETESSTTRGTKVVSQVSTLRPETPREGGAVVGVTPEGAKIIRGARLIRDREIVSELPREIRAKPITKTKEVFTPLRAGLRGEEPERFFVTKTGLAVRRMAGESPPVGARKISERQFLDIRAEGVGVAREEAKIRKAQEFGLAVGEELLRKQATVRERKRLEKRIQDIGFAPTVGEEITRVSPIIERRRKQVFAEREFVGKVGEISEKDIKAFEKLQLETGVAPGLTVVGKRFQPRTVTPSEIRAIKEAEKPLFKLEKRKEEEFLRREAKAREKGLIGIPERVVFGGLAGATTTFSFIRRRPAEAILTAGAFAVSPAKIAAAVGTLLVGGRFAQRTLLKKEPVITAAAGTVGEVLPFAAGAALGIGAVRGLGRGVEFRVKGRPTEIRRLKGVDLTKAFIKDSKLVIPEKALISEVFLRRLKKAKPPKPADVIPLELKGLRLGQISPTAIESRVIKSFGLAKVKKGKVTIEEVGFPDVKVGKTLVTPEPTPLKPLRTLPEQRFPTERFVERKGFERLTQIRDDFILRREIREPIVELGVGRKVKVKTPRLETFFEEVVKPEVFLGKDGQIKRIKPGVVRRELIIKEPKIIERPEVKIIDLFKFRRPPRDVLEPTQIEISKRVRPTKVRLKSEIEVKIEEAFKLPKGAEIIATERLLGRPIKKTQLPEELRLELFPRKVKRKPIKLGKRAEILIQEPKLDVFERARIKRVGDILEVKPEPIFKTRDIRVIPIIKPIKEDIFEKITKEARFKPRFVPEEEFIPPTRDVSIFDILGAGGVSRFKPKGGIEAGFREFKAPRLFEDVSRQAQLGKGLIEGAKLRETLLEGTQKGVVEQQQKLNKLIIKTIQQQQQQQKQEQIIETLQEQQKRQRQEKLLGVAPPITITKPILDVAVLTRLGIGLKQESLLIQDIKLIQEQKLDVPRPIVQEVLPTPPRIPPIGLPFLPPLLFPDSGLLRRRKVKIPRRGFRVTPTLFDLTFTDLRDIKKRFSETQLFTGGELFRFGVKRKKKKKKVTRRRKRKVKRKK